MKQRARQRRAVLFTVALAAVAGPWAAADDVRRPELSPPQATAATLVGDAALVTALQDGEARPVGLASMDFDQDGLDDVVAFFAHHRTAIVVLHRANPDAWVGAAGDALPRFRSEADVFGAPATPDFFAAGDFDNDGRADVLVAERRGSRFTILPGDGRGKFASARTVALDGQLTALAVGQVNRTDSVADVVVAVETAGHPRLLVYESAEGAERAEPEAIPLSARATAIAIGELHGDLAGDVVALAGREIVIVRGRDRHLGETVERMASVEPPPVERRPIGFEGTALTLGRFAHERLTDIVVRSAADSLYRTPGHRPGLLETLRTAETTRSAPRTFGDAASAPVAALALDLDRDALEDVVFLEENGRGQITTSQVLPRATLLVTNKLNSGLGSLRQAILDANSFAGPDRIHFSIPGAAPHVIALTSPLPTIPETLTVDGTSQPGFAMTPLVFVDGAASAAGCGLCFVGRGADSSAVLGLGLLRFPGDAIRFDGSWSCVVDQSHLGTNTGGTGAAANVNGVAVLDSQFTRIGTVQGNLISGNSNVGVFLRGGPSGGTWSSSNVPQVIPDLGQALSTVNVSLGGIVEDVDVSLDVTHSFDGDLVLTLVSPTGDAVRLASNVGGGGDHFTGTTFDDEAVTPIAVGTAPFTGSFLPAEALSTLDGGAIDGIWTLVVSDTVGGDSGTLNAWSLRFLHRTFGNSVQRNRIGTNVAGTLAVGNTIGVHVVDEASDVIGGTGPDDGNLISGNGTGVRIEGGLSRGHRIEGNRIGIAATGTSALANTDGVVLDDFASGCTIGGTASGSGNVISGNVMSGIAAHLVRQNRYQGNFVGTAATGTVAIANGVGFTGLAVRDELIGGLAPGARNVISGNTGHALELASGGVGGNNSIVGNVVGTDVTGLVALGNGSGVRLLDDNDTLLGNLISGNVGDGVVIEGDGHVLDGNRIGVDDLVDAKLPNRHGVRILAGRFNSIGSASGAPNTIAGNLADGVRIEGTPALGPTTYVSGDVPKTILDLSTVASTLFVADDGVLLDLDVRLDITHTWDADLTITLIDPAGNRIPLAQNRGGNGDGYAGTVFDDEAASSISAGVPPFAASFRPEQPLAYVDGHRLNGTWTLEVADQAGGDFGTLDTWRLLARYVPPLENLLESNWIGTDSLGSAGLENGGNGVNLVDAGGNRIGDASGNTIAGNAWGVMADGPLSSGNRIRGNSIGGTVATNGLGGIRIHGGSGNDISDNTIRRNSGPGAWVTAGYNHSIRGNSILDNAGLGIDLATVGVNPNDVADADGGANDQQNFVVITGLTPLGPTIRIDGFLDAEPNRSFLLDFYANPVADPSGYGEGAQYLGGIVVESDFGLAPFGFVAPAGLGVYTATATGPGGSTSEFSGRFALPLEVPDTVVVSKAAMAVQLAYDPACSATDHAVFRGASPIAGAPSWSSVQCGFGVTGSILFDPGSPVPNQFYYWVVVGQTPSLEGSYGQGSSGTERPEAVALGSCDRPLNLGGVCP